MDTLAESVAESLKAFGGVEDILAAAPEAVSALFPDLTLREKTILLGIGRTPPQKMPDRMIGAKHTLTGSFVNTPAQTEHTLRFSHLFQTLPVTEQMPSELQN